LAKILSPGAHARHARACSGGGKSAPVDHRSDSAQIAAAQQEGPEAMSDDVIARGDRMEARIAGLPPPLVQVT
jgi:hypothetical protein